jgi:hypothetical protein
MKNRPFSLLSALAMVGALYAVVAMSLVNAKSSVKPPEGFRSPILALEFAQDNAVIDSVFNLSRATPAEIHFNTQCFDLGVQLDYLFILAYAGFMLCFALQSRHLGQKSHWLGILFALLAALADVLENGQLRAIYAQIELGQRDFSEHFSALHFWTCLKFCSTGAYFLAFTAFFWKANWLGKIVVLAALGALLCWAGAVFMSPKTWADAMFGMIFLAFAGAMFFGLRYRGGE